MRIIRKAELRKKVGLHPVHIGRLEKRGAFPQRIRLGPQSVGWVEDEVDAWIEKKKRERDSQAWSPTSNRT